MRLHHYIMILTLATAIGARAQASMMNYGDFTGGTVKYTDVSEESLTDTVPLFGPPVVSGNVLDFSSVSFNSTSSSGTSDTTTSTLTTTILALAGHAIGAIDIVEAGDFQLVGQGGVLTYATVGAVGLVEIVEVDGVAIVPVTDTFNVVFTPSDGGWNLLDDGPGPLVSGSWSGSGHIDLGLLLVSKGIGFTLGATKVNLSLTNELTTGSETGTAAFIAKKDFGASIEVSVVPEPAAGALALLGLGGLLAWSCRRAGSTPR